MDRLTARLDALVLDPRDDTALAHEADLLNRMGQNAAALIRSQDTGPVSCMVPNLIALLSTLRDRQAYIGHQRLLKAWHHVAGAKPTLTNQLLEPSEEEEEEEESDDADDSAPTTPKANRGLAAAAAS